MKKILMLASEASHFKNFHIPYINKLVQEGDKVFTASNGSLEAEGAAHILIPFKKKLISLGNIRVIFKLAGLMRRESFDLVCTNSTLAGFMGRMAVILSGCGGTKVVHICHGYLFNDDGGRRAKTYLFFEKLVRRRTDLLVVMNDDDLKIAEKYSLGNRIAFIKGMGLDAVAFPELAAERTADMRKKLGAGDDTLLFLCAAEFSARKNQYTIIKALSLLKRSDCKVVFAGDGRLIEKCRDLSRKLGVEDKTVFLGCFGEMNLLYRCCDCLISASRFEGLPFNVMESLYCGESVILSDIKGNRDLAAAERELCAALGEPSVSRLFPYEDCERLAELMEGAEKPRKRQCRLSDKYFLENIFEENIKLFNIIL
ncbi:MAG: glycosyltransferase [Bacteroides sp.]|nr:glycosyltransferase [Bacteroides sp.]